MNFELDCALKYKLMDCDEIVVDLDRLTRFKNPEIKYKRVFYDVILKNLSYPSVSKHKLDELPSSFIKRACEEIWNESTESLFGSSKCSFTLKELDEFQYDVKDEYTLDLMSANLTIAPIIKNTVTDTSPLNLIFLKKLYEKYRKDKDLLTVSNEIREKNCTLFPIKKLVLTEGITEEILLPKFAKILNYDFKQNGVFILATGGKSKVLSLYAELKYILKIPVFVLLDNDAENVFHDVKSVLRNEDNVYLIQSGEFEDILPKDLIQKAFSEMYYDVKPATKDELYSEEGTCKSLQALWKSRGLGEFRKAHLAKAVKEVINSRNDASDEIEMILDLISYL